MKKLELFFSSQELGIRDDDPAFMARFERNLAFEKALSPAPARTARLALRTVVGAATAAVVLRLASPLWTSTWHEARQAAAQFGTGPQIALVAAGLAYVLIEFAGALEADVL